MKYFVIYMFLINFLTFIFFGIDKYKAIKKKYRISEKTLFTLNLIGGGFGGILGMIFFGHKTIKTSFQIKYYIITLLWLIGIFIYLLK